LKNSEVHDTIATLLPEKWLNEKIVEMFEGFLSIMFRTL
jgi:hypothetical protein